MSTNRLDDDEGQQLSCIVAKPEVLTRLLVAQENIARTQLAQGELNALQAQCNEHSLSAVRSAATWSLIAAVFSFACLVAVLASR